jgi:hypothetical protein
VTEYQPRINAVLRHLDEFLALFASLIAQQRLPAPRKQMEFAKVVLEDRSRDLRLSQARGKVETFVHELWSLGGDMPHLDFDVSRLSGADLFLRMKAEISTEALMLTKDLSLPGAQAELASEWSRS